MVLQDEDKNLTSVLNSVNNGPLYICDTAFLTALKPDALSTDVHSVLLFTTVTLLVFLPFTILLNILVIVAVNSTHELRTTSNILLACLATTDLLIALTIQPCFIAMEVYFIQGRSVAEFCVLEKVSGIFFTMFCSISLFHIVLISLERFLAIKHPFFYENYSSNKISIISSVIVWILAVIPALKDLIDSKNDFVSVVFVDVLSVCSILVIIVCHVTIYFEARRHQKQIASQQISREAREKFEKDRKSLKTTTIIVLTVFFCNFVSISVNFFLDAVTEFNTAYILFFLALTLTLLNSLVNPLIYAARNKRVRLAFVHHLLRQQIQQTDQMEIRVNCCRSTTVRPQEGETSELP